MTNDPTLMNHLGNKIRETRENQNLLLRQVAAYLKIDIALLSKAERGGRNLSRVNVTRLAELFKIPQEDLLSLWLCDRVLRSVGDDPLAELGIKQALYQLKN